MPANIFLFKVNIRNTRKKCKICSKLTIKHQNNVNDIVLVILLLIFFLLLLLTYFTPFSTTVDFEQVNIRWDEISNYL